MRFKFSFSSFVEKKSRSYLPSSSLVAGKMGVKRRVAAASASVFIVLLILPLYIGVWNLLLTGLSINDSNNGQVRYIERSTLSLGREQEDDVEEKYLSSTVQKEQHRNSSQKRRSRRKKERIQLQELHAQQSPACNPNFRSSSETKKFKRLFFYHARKAGGTSLSYYFEKVAFHHGLIFKQGEGVEAEEPGTHKFPTFYVAHMREPVRQYHSDGMRVNMIILNNAVLTTPLCHVYCSCRLIDRLAISNVS